ncbi:MAG TPA: substrate-binding domain-containing protein [Solirubrobacterales bacterium]|nr:substrate-binding domain-containing protein [Solirubrobacterales bacterium]
MKIKTLAIAALALAGLAAPASAGAVTYIGSGSVAAQPVLQALFSTYTKQVNPKVKFVYTANGGNAGVKDVQNGTSQFAGNARTPLPSDAGTTYIKMFMDGLCMDVNAKNPLTNISIQQTHDIYRGLITNWSQIPGSLDTTISPVGRDTNGGTYNFFLQSVLNNEPPASNVNALTADGLVVNAVKQDINAIGYAGLAWQGSKKLKTLKVNGIPCTPSKISVEPLKYPLSRYLFFVLPGDGSTSPKGLLKFVDWMRRSELAGEVILKAGGVPAFNKGF